MIDLQPFCGRDEYRPYLHKPFSRGAYTYATDGRLLLRVARRDDVPENDRAPDCEAAVFSKLQCSEYAAPDFALPDVKPEREDCILCEGRGFEHDCPSCQCTCPECDGAGHIEKPQSTTINGSLITLKYARLMFTLPDLQLQVPPCGEKPMLFKFDGGDGAVMPRHAKANDHYEVERSQAA